MISVNITSKAFGNTPVLSHLRLDIAKGETVALIGPSGVGKSTLLRIVAGLDPNFEGSVTRPEKMAFVFQEPTLLLWRSCLQNVTLPHAGLTDSRAAQILQKVGLSDKCALFPGQLSLGQQRRLSLARAFAGTPEFLVMDEPFVSLDPATVDAMLTLSENLIAEHRPATLFVTHDRGEADRLADRVLTLKSGTAGATLAQ